jgi:hypothetical protein
MMERPIFNPLSVLVFNALEINNIQQVFAQLIQGAKYIDRPHVLAAATILTSLTASDGPPGGLRLPDFSVAFIYRVFNKKQPLKLWLPLSLP